MRFANDIFLYLLLLMPGVIVLLVLSWKKRSRLLDAFGKPGIMKKLTGSVSVEQQKLKLVLAAVAVFFFILALAGPQIGTRMVEVQRRGIDILIAIDCSTSMEAQDIQPSRLVKAKRELSALIGRLNGDRIGIIAFSGTAFLQCPLTLDYNAAKMFLDIIDTNLIPYPGTNLAGAIELAIKSFSRKERKYKALILLTDGEDHEEKLEPAINEAKKEGIRIYTVGIGSPDGEPLPVRDAGGNVTGYKKDKKGAVVMSKLEDKILREIALKTGGKYYRATPTEFEIEKIYEDIAKMDKKDLKSKLASQYEDRFQYFVFIILALLVAEFLLTGVRRGHYEA